MREFVSDLQSERKVFIGDFDSYTIIKHGISPNELLKLSKFGLLLFDKLMLPAAFFWQTEEMAQLQLRLEQAIRLGYILPIIRDSGCTRDIRDYHGRREVESEKIAGLEVFQRPELASEIASSQDADQVKLLDDLKSFAHLDKKSIRDVYVENWLSDLENHREVNSLNLLVAQCNISEDDRMVIYQELSNITKQELFSRAFCIETIEKLVPSGGCQRLLDERASWLYLKSNADAYSSSFYYSRDPYNGMVFEDNLQALS